MRDALVCDVWEHSRAVMAVLVGREGESLSLIAVLLCFPRHLWGLLRYPEVMSERNLSDPIATPSSASETSLPDSKP